MTGLPTIAVRHHLATLVGCLLIGLLPGAVGSAFTPDAWYFALEKSSLTPPNWVFPVAWTSLYLMIGVSLYAFLINADGKCRPALVMFAIQLVLNAAWSWLFFGQHEPGLALVDIVLLWLSIAATAVLFGRASRLAGVLLVPYLLWVSFATYLNVAIWAAN